MVAVNLRDFQDAFHGVLKAARITDHVAWPNRLYQPTKGIPYLRPENAARSRTPVGFGVDGVMQWTGTYQVGCFAPRDAGEREQEEMATKVMAAFPRGLTLITPQGIRIIVSHSTAPAAVPFGDWSNLPVSVWWFATEPPP